MRVFHATTPETITAIQRSGFRDAEGSYLFVNFWLKGVFVSKTPADVNDGAKGNLLLAIDVPDEELAPYWFIEEVDGKEIEWEACVPAALLNRYGPPFDQVAGDDSTSTSTSTEAT